MTGAGPEGRGHAPPWRLLAPVAVFLATFAVFAPSLGHGLVDFDDLRLVVETTGYRGLSGEHLRWMFTATVLGHWQPLTWLSYAVDYSIAGVDPAQFHLTSVLLHSANGALLCALITRLVGAARGEEALGRATTHAAAALATLLWSIHPLRVESAAWVTERRDVLSGFFLLLTALAYLRAFPAGSGRPGSMGWYLASIALLSLSLLAKAWGMSFFVVAIVLDWYPLRRLPLSPLRWVRPDALRVLAMKVPYVLLGLASARMASWAINSIGAMRTLEDWPLRSRIPQAFYGLVYYLWKTIWPTKLCALYELRHGLNPWAPAYLACYALVIGGAVLLLVFHRRFPAVAAAAAVYAASVAPVLGLFQSGDQFVADRYSYIACMGWSALAVGGMVVLLGRCRGVGQAGAARVLIPAAALVVALSVGARMQLGAWRDSISLWRHAWMADPTRMMPHVNYGLNIEARGRELEREGRAAEARALDDEARDHYQIATRLKPDDGRGWFPLGNLLRRYGDLAGAEHAYRESARTLPQAYMPLVQLGSMLMEKPDGTAEALAAFRAAVDAVEHPRPASQPSGLPYLALGAALKKSGDLPGARAAFERAREYGQATGGTKGDPAERAQVLREAELQLRALPGG